MNNLFGHKEQTVSFHVGKVHFPIPNIYVPLSNVIGILKNISSNSILKLKYSLLLIVRDRSVVVKYPVLRCYSVFSNAQFVWFETPLSISKSASVFGWLISVLSVPEFLLNIERLHRSYLAQSPTFKMTALKTHCSNLSFGDDFILFTVSAPSLPGLNDGNFSTADLTSCLLSRNSWTILWIIQ